VGRWRFFLVVVNKLQASVDYNLNHEAVTATRTCCLAIQVHVSQPIACQFTFRHFIISSPPNLRVSPMPTLMHNDIPVPHLPPLPPSYSSIAQTA
jgi:hypothetical protein